jgi:hypothetical protein
MRLAGHGRKTMVLDGAVLIEEPSPHGPGDSETERVQQSFNGGRRFKANIIVEKQDEITAATLESTVVDCRKVEWPLIS